MSELIGRLGSAHTPAGSGRRRATLVASSMVEFYLGSDDDMIVGYRFRWSHVAESASHQRSTGRDSRTANYTLPRGVPKRPTGRVGRGR